MPAGQFLIDNWRDARNLGPRFLLRHLKRHSRLATVPVRGVGDVRLRPRTSDGRVFRQVFGDHQYELRSFGQWPAIEARYQQILASGRRPLVIDAGANVGASPLWFANLFPRAAVVAIEPDPANVEVLSANTRSHDIEVVAAAVGSVGGTVELINEDCESWAVSTKRSPGGGVRICTIGDIVADHREHCDLFLVKIDIEGFESDLFATNTAWLDDVTVVIIEPHDWMLPGHASSRTFQRALLEQDFELLISGENLVFVRMAAAVERADRVRPAIVA